MTKFDSCELFDAIWNAADAAGYLDDLKNMMDYKSNRSYSPVGFVDCDFSIEAHVEAGGCEGTWIDVEAVRDGKRALIGDVKSLWEGAEAFRIMGAAAGMLSYVAQEVIWSFEKQEHEQK